MKEEISKELREGDKDEMKMNSKCPRDAAAYYNFFLDNFFKM